MLALKVNIGFHCLACIRLDPVHYVLTHTNEDIAMIYWHAMNIIPVLINSYDQCVCLQELPCTLRVVNYSDSLWSMHRFQK